jgi:asparagine synthetase B (glutamine-hydrolysing)
MSLPTPGQDCSTDQETAVHVLKHMLTESLKLRVLNVPGHPPTESSDDVRIAVLFSGGIDCTVLARLIHDVLHPAQGVDLNNVAFENPRIAAQRRDLASQDGPSIYDACPDRVTGWASFRELLNICQNRHWRFVTVWFCLLSWSRSLAKFSR